MNKYTRRRMVAWSALLAVIGVGGLEIVKDKSDDLSNVVTQDVYAAYEEAETTVATSGRAATFNTAATSMSTLSTTSTTYEVTTTEPTCYYTELLKYCGNTWGNTELYLTEYEVQLLSTLVYLEGGGESFECQKNIASTVINRMLTSDYTLSEILYADNQYSVASRLAYSSPSESCEEAVMEVLNYGATLPIYVTFFRADYYHEWGDQVPYCNVDDTYFSYSQSLFEAYN